MTYIGDIGEGGGRLKKGLKRVFQNKPLISVDQTTF